MLEARQVTADRKAQVRPAPHVVAAVQGDRTVLLDWARGRYFGLDEAGTRIWSLLADGASMGLIVDLLEEAYDAPREVLERDAWSFVWRLAAARLVTLN